jgi:hypothetical protein
VVVAPVAASVAVVSVATSDGEASPASACEDAKPKLHTARTIVATLMWRGHRGAAATARLISPKRRSSDLSVRRPEAWRPAVSPAACEALSRARESLELVHAR